MPLSVRGPSLSFLFSLEFFDTKGDFRWEVWGFCTFSETVRQANVLIISKPGPATACLKGWGLGGGVTDAMFINNPARILCPKMALNRGNLTKPSCSGSGRGGKAS